MCTGSDIKDMESFESMCTYMQLCIMICMAYNLHVYYRIAWNYTTRRSFEGI